MQLTLVLGSRNISSWSFRPWLALRQGRVPFSEVVVELRRPDTAARIAEWSPSGKVPVLLIDGRPIWESLAICEVAAELAPDLWPADPLARAEARAVSAEMHTGFAALRRFLPMDFSARFAPPGRLLRDVGRDVARIEAIWTGCRDRHADHGPFLFGPFTVADAMFAPVVSRFVTYGIELGEAATAYMSAMRALPAWQEWADAAAREVERGPAEPAVSAWSTALSRDIPSADERPAVTRPGPGPAMAGATAVAPSGLSRAAEGQPGGRVRQGRSGDIKPIGDGIHRRR